MVGVFKKHHYLSEKLSTGVILLYTNRLIQQTADSLLGLFFPIFLYQKYGSINAVLIFFLISYLLGFLLAAPGAMISSRINFRRALIISVFGGTLYYLALYFFDQSLMLFSGLAILAINFDCMLYWVPYHSDFANFTNRKNRGRTIAYLASVASLIAIVVPVFSGFVITKYGFEVIFLMVIVVYLSSVIPFFFLPPISEQYSFTYRETFKYLFHPRDRKILLSYMAEGIDSIIGLAVWPIFIWEILKGNYEAMGIISSSVVLFTVVIRLIVGKYTDKFDRKKMIKFGSVLYSLGWIAKIFVQTGFQIFITSTYHNFAAVAMKTPFDALTYDKASDSGRFVDEFTVLREMALALGRVVGLILALVLFNFFNINYSFFLAALAALLVNIL